MFNPINKTKIMKKQLTNRLETLKNEYEKGQKRLQALEGETANVRASMLRISGAIQVLNELLEIEPKQQSEPVENGVTTS